jgi:glutamyl-tRNA synthetase
MTAVRTRFAPSPTGYIHVGNVRAALFPWLFARQQGGAFVLRIEDTDQARFVEGAQDLIMDTLSWLGIDWDEGPDKGGAYGPYVQTERKSSYHVWAQKLIDKGLAYADPYSPEQVNEFREQAKAAKKPFLYRNFRPENPPAWDGSQPLRFKATNIKRWDWHDPVMGDLSAGPEALDDFILVKSDGLPTYNFAHVIDDAEMAVTHVVRGLEYIASIPKYLSLYEALELTPPVLICLPHIMAPDGKKKLGKRDGAKSVTEYRQQGILPEAMLNFLASMGWNDGTEQEVFTRDELITKFSWERVQRSGARFDEQRLLWMNGSWIRSLSLDDLFARSTNYWPETANGYDDEYKKQVLALVQERLKYLAELPQLTDFFFADLPVDLELITGNKQLKKFELPELHTMLEQAIAKLEQSDWTADDLQTKLNELLEEIGQKPGVIFSLIRIATTWAPFSPALNETLAVLGRDRSLQTIRNSYATLGNKLA